MSDSQNAVADASMSELIRKLRNFGDIARDAAPEVAREFEAELRHNITAAITPEGTPWLPKKKGEGLPLRTAGNALTVRNVGTVIVAELRGHIALHHLGKVKGGVQRAILPSRFIPATAKAAIKTVIDRKLTEHFNG